MAVGANSSTLNAKAIAIGNATAIADSSISIGEKTTSSDENAIAMGASSISSGDGSLSLGSWSEATGYRSVAVGPSAESSSYASVALGSESGARANYAISIGEFSRATEHAAVAIGDQAKAQGSQSVAIGQNSKVNGGNYSAALGYSADASGHSAVAIGNNAKAVNNYNIAIGANACQYVTGTNKTCIGANSGPSDSAQRSDSSTESLYFGTAGRFISGSTNMDTNSIFELHKKGDYAVAFLNADLVVNGFTWTQVGGKSGHGDAIGFFRSKTWKNQVELYNEARPGFPPASPFSDRRLKYVGNESTCGLDKIKQLKVFNYTFKKDETKTPHVGVIAQDLQKIFPDAVKKGTDGFLTIRFEDMFFAMVNAIKELDTRMTALEKENQELKARIERLEAKVK